MDYFDPSFGDPNAGKNVLPIYRRPAFILGALYSACALLVIVMGAFAAFARDPADQVSRDSPELLSQFAPKLDALYNDGVASTECRFAVDLAGIPTLLTVEYRTKDGAVHHALTAQTAFSGAWTFRSLGGPSPQIIVRGSMSGRPGGVDADAAADCLEQVANRNRVEATAQVSLAGQS